MRATIVLHPLVKAAKPQIHHDLIFPNQPLDTCRIFTPNSLICHYK